MTNIYEIESKISSILENNPNQELLMLLFMLLGGMDDDFRTNVLDKVTDEMRYPSGNTHLMKDIMVDYLNNRIKGCD